MLFVQLEHLLRMILYVVIFSNYHIKYGPLLHFCIFWTFSLLVFHPKNIHTLLVCCFVPNTSDTNTLIPVFLHSVQTEGAGHGEGAQQYTKEVAAGLHGPAAAHPAGHLQRE